MDEIIAFVATWFALCFVRVRGLFRTVSNAERHTCLGKKMLMQIKTYQRAYRIKLEIRILKEMKRRQIYFDISWCFNRSFRRMDWKKQAYLYRCESHACFSLLLFIPKASPVYKALSLNASEFTMKVKFIVIQESTTLRQEWVSTVGGCFVQIDL